MINQSGWNCERIAGAMGSEVVPRGGEQIIFPFSMARLRPDVAAETAGFYHLVH